jgi:hypothetical protein
MTANGKAKNLMLDVAGDFARITFLDSRQFVCFVGKGKSLSPFSKFARIRAIRVFTRLRRNPSYGVAGGCFSSQSFWKAGSALDTSWFY